jgi:hypothetical protein
MTGLQGTLREFAAELSGCPGGIVGPFEET